MSQFEPDREFDTREQFAERNGISVRTVDALIKKRKIVSAKYGRIVRIPSGEWTRFLWSHAQTAERLRIPTTLSETAALEKVLQSALRGLLANPESRKLLEPVVREILDERKAA